MMADPRRGRKTGRVRSAHDPAFLSCIPNWGALKAARAVGAPPIPEALSWRKGLPAMLGPMCNAPDPNDPTAPVLGCCTNSATAHLRQIWTFNAQGTEETISTAALVQGYSETCGYVPGDPSTDQGGDLLTVLKAWMTTGLPNSSGGRDTILGFFGVDPTSPEDVRRVIAECGGLYTAADIPASWAEINPGDSFRMDGPGTEGHCMNGFGYQPGLIDADTWGFAVPTPDDVFARYFDQVFAVVSMQWIEKTGKTPYGMTVADLNAQLAQLQAAVTIP